MMDSRKIIGFVIFATLVALVIVISFQARDILSPTVERMSEQGFVNVGENIIADFTIYNPSLGTKTFRYSLFYNGTRRFEDSVAIKRGMSFQFGGHYRATEPGRVTITALVYEEGVKERLIENTTYFVTVKPK
jgi:hypothetical protein